MLKSFNRTFMELKLEQLREEVRLLTGFNRTFMELKLRIGVLILKASACFNRTFMELKYVCNIDSSRVVALF